MTNAAKNLWVLTEERPKKEVLKMIFNRFAQDLEIGFFGNELKIIPILNEDKCFAFTYEVIGFNCSRVSHVYIKTVSGASSFTDFLIFYQNEEPSPETDTPMYAIEETKTDDKESRNTGVYQRCSKFVYINQFYSSTKKIMLYDLQIEQKENPTETYIFGTRLLLTLGVDILGKKLDDNLFKPFSSISELIEAKNSMRRAPKGNVPILIKQFDDKITISGRLFKNGGIGHDPNIGALSIISAVLRELGWNKPIVITDHGLSQCHVGKRNKFVQIANTLNITLDGLTIPNSALPHTYWHYDLSGEKLGTIFIHIAVENFTSSFSVFENHAGCEKSYFQTPDGKQIPLAKYADRKAYKAGDKSQIVYIPDLVLIDIDEHEAITIEGKKYCNKQNGIDELRNYDSFDSLYLKKYYPSYHIVRTVVLYGSENDSVYEVEVGFLLNEKGKLVLGVKAPRLFTTAIANLLSYWK